MSATVRSRVLSKIRIKPAHAAVLASHRGAPGAMAEAVSAVQEMAGAVKEFRTSLDKRIANLEKAVDDVSAGHAAARITSIAGGKDPRMARAMQTVADFARGNISAMAVQAAMSTDSNPDGGFLVPEEAETSVAAVLRDQSPLRRLARVQPISQAAWRKTIWLGGAGADWVGERQSRPLTDPSRLAEIVIPANELYACPALTSTLIDDARIDVAGELLGEVGKAFAEKESAGFVSGDGNKCPRGFLTYPTATTKDAVRAFGTIQRLHTGEAGGFAAPTTTVSPADILIDMVYALKKAHRQNATWLMNSATAGVVRKFKDTEGNYIWQRSNVAGQPDLLLGHAVEIDEAMPDVAADAIPIAFADWQSAYVIVDRLGTSVLRDPFTSKPYVLFYTTRRVGGGLFDSNAIKLLKVAS